MIEGRAAILCSFGCIPSSSLLLLSLEKVATVDWQSRMLTDFPDIVFLINDPIAATELCPGRALLRCLATIGIRYV